MRCLKEEKSEGAKSSQSGTRGKGPREPLLLNQLRQLSISGPTKRTALAIDRRVAQVFSFATRPDWLELEAAPGVVVEKHLPLLLLPHWTKRTLFATN